MFMRRERLTTADLSYFFGEQNMAVDVASKTVERVVGLSPTKEEKKERKERKKRKKEKKERKERRKSPFRSRVLSP